MQWSGSPPQAPTNWDTITYTYDPAGRRIKKNVDGYPTRYVYDGGHVIAEYDDSGLLRKYIYGARVDEPVCMIDVADSNAAYYYHFDGLGSVVALSDSDSDSCQSYEYSAYGQVAASDPNHPNPYMFTGRRFDIETGLYYYRARYYNPHIGRFMQTDPVGYGYTYCSNNPLGRVDPFGLLDTSIWIPTISIVNDPYGPNAFNDVEWWLNDVGFFKDYPDWEVTNISIEGKDFLIDLYSEDETLEPEIDYSIWDVGGVQVVAFNGIGRLDSRDRTLDMIIKLSFHEMNQQERPLIPTIFPGQLANPFKIADLIEKLFLARQTGFTSSSLTNYRYKGNVYDKSEINYILMGHGMKHQKVNYYLGVVLAQQWKLWGRRHLFFPPEVLYWFTKGYGEYDERKNW